jgi:hypothetical protein
MSLAEALKGMSGTAGPTVPFVGPALPDVREDVTGSLEKRLEESRDITAIARETLPLLEEVETCLDDQPRVNRLIAKIDGLRARMLELNDCYELITALSQQSELERFRQDRQLAAAKLVGLERQKAQLKRDIANVKSLIAASGMFEGLIEKTVGRLK